MPQGQVFEVPGRGFRARAGGLFCRTNRALPLAACAGGLLLLAPGRAPADIGQAQLRAADSTLTGAGIRVAQPEASSGANPPNFEVNPAAVNQPVALFTWSSTAQANVSTFPNAAGSESGHADTVGNLFYGGGGAGVSPGVSHVDNYDADYFVNNFVFAATQVNVPALVINQSFITRAQGTENATDDQLYDNYAARFNKVIVSGAGNAGKPTSPSSAYNLIAVGASNAGATTAVGPTTDGRSKPDISAPANETSYSTPQVSGAAAILLQAGLRGDAGTTPATVSAATNAITIKALLLNGADKPAGWTRTPTQPLDPVYGAGVANVYNSYQNLRGGFQGATTATTTGLGGAHAPPTGVAGNVASSIGWNNATLTSGPTTDAVDNYFFTLGAGTTYDLTATLDWNRQVGQATINNLDLFLYDATTGALVDQSISGLDNVEYLYDLGLPAGRYDLQVLKHGGVAGVTTGVVSNAETYALAFNFAATPEPTSLGFLAGAGVLLGRGGRRRGGRAARAAPAPAPRAGVSRGT